MTDGSGDPSDGNDGSPGSGSGLLEALVPDVIRRSYSRQLLVAFLLLGVLVSASGFLIQQRTGSMVREDVSDRLVLQTEAEAAELSEWRKRNRVLARVLSSNRAFEENASVSIDAFLEDQVSNRLPDDVRSLFLFRRADSTLVNASNPATTVPDFDQVGAFGSYREVAVSQPYTNYAGETVIAFVSPVESRPGTLLAMTVDVGGAARTFRHAYAEGFTYVVDSGRNVVFAENESRLLSTYAAGRPYPTVLQRGKNGRSGYVGSPVYDQLTPRNTVATYAPVEGTDWVVVKHFPADRAYRLENTVTVAVVAFVAFTLVSVFAIGTTFGYVTLSALRRLSEKARSVANGEYDVNFETRRIDEFGTLFDSLANMRDGLRSRIRELDRANDELEDRTVAISVMNRLLRHNLRNDISLVGGYAEEIAADSEDPDVVDRAEEIQSVGKHLARQAYKARRVETILGHDHDENDWVDLRSVIVGVVERAREQYPDAEIELDASAPATAPVYGCDQVELAFENLVENAIEHNDDPRVEVSLAWGDGTATVTVADDGPGIPDHEVAALGREESSLEHVSGMGLWLVEFVVDHVDGEVAFDTSRWGGTVVTVDLVAVDGRSDGES